MAASSASTIANTLTIAPRPRAPPDVSREAWQGPLELPPMNAPPYFLPPCLRVVAFLSLVFTQQPMAFAERIEDAGQVDRIRHIILSQGNEPAALAHLVQLSSNLAPAAAIGLYLQIADEHVRKGNYDFAGEVLRQVVDQYPEQPATANSLITLIGLYTSSEIAHTTQTKPRQTEASQLPLYAMYLAEKAIKRQGSLAGNSALVFHCAVASRLSGHHQAAKSWLTPLKYDRQRQPWHDRARNEAWLQSARRKSPPNRAARCLGTDNRPHLDGLLDEPLWKSAKSLSLSASNSSSTKTPASQIRFARDDKFLYFAIHCQKMAGVTYAPDHSPRTHDADLAGQDRVRLLLDLDRDYATGFQLSVDHNGKTADACWHNTSWNPRWYVAAHSDDSTWTIEAAIPWKELTHKRPQALDAWALAAVRQTPSGESQFWIPPQPEDPGSELGDFGLLLFD